MGNSIYCKYGFIFNVNKPVDLVAVLGLQNTYQDLFLSWVILSNFKVKGLKVIVLKV